MSRPLATLVLVISAAGGLIGAGAALGPDSRVEPKRVLAEQYVGSDACRECHASNHASWSSSYHRRMTQYATPDAVLAPWEGTTPALDGVAWQLTREPDGLRARAVGPTGAQLAAPVRIVLATGSHHYQIYWFDAGGPDLGQLPLVWHLGEKRWVPRRSVFLAPAPESMFAEGGRWSRSCIQCHTTNGTQRDPEDGRTHVAELGIACEACHGPGAPHVALQKERRDLTAEAVAALPPDTTIVDPSDLPHDRSSQVCGQCHGIHPLTKAARSEWETKGFSFRPGEDLAASRDLLRAPLAKNTAEMKGFVERNPGTLEMMFWSDGQVRVSGREYNGLVESPCYQRGTMSCLSCHEMHPGASDPRPRAEWANDQLRPGFDGPRACLSCHAEYESPEKLAAHTHHAAGSSGSDCLNCHMPYTTYGLTKAIRSHTITSPSIAATLASGRPDACNQCHLDETLGWAADRLHAWYGHDRPKLSDEQEKIAASVLWALSGDAGQRALMAWSFGWAPARAASGTGWMPYLLSTLMQDPFDAVRFVAMRSARADPRHAALAIDFTRPLAEQQLSVRAGYLKDWQQRGLVATPEQRAAVLVGADGKLDEALFRAIFARVDTRLMSLAE